jgi:hypothetical protein
MVVQMPSYTGMVVDPAAGIVTLYARHTSDRMIDVASDEMAAQGVALVVEEAAFSREDLDRAQAAVWERREEFSLQAVGGYEDGHGLKVVAQSPSEDMRRQLEQTAGAPITLERGNVTPTTRADDNAPFWGGAIIHSPTGTCSSAFGVHDQSSGARYLVTAAHCGNKGDVFKAPSGAIIGNVTWSGYDQRIDAALIAANSGNEVYDGDWNNGDGYAKPVAGYANTVVGQSVCVSGAASGVRCGNRVAMRGVSISVKGHSVVEDYAEQKDGLEAVGNGDSGGPVFSVSPSDNYARVTALGVISARSDYVVTCRGLPDSRRVCSSNFYFARFNNLKIDANVVPNGG